MSTMIKHSREASRFGATVWHDCLCCLSKYPTSNWEQQSKRDYNDKIYLRDNKLYKTNQGSNIFVGSFSNRDHVRGSIQSEEKDNPSKKDVISSRLDPFNFTSVAPQLFD